MDAESLDIDHGTVIASTASNPAPEPVHEVKRRRERRPYSAEQLEVLQNELQLAIRRKNKDIADEISCLNGCVRYLRKMCVIGCPARDMLLEKQYLSKIAIIAGGGGEK